MVSQVALLRHASAGIVEMFQDGGFDPPALDHGNRGCGFGHGAISIVLPQSGFAPENLTTLAHFSVSFAIIYPVRKSIFLRPAARDNGQRRPYGECSMGLNDSATEKYREFVDTFFENPIINSSLV
jgi:hypothetical protein